MGDRLRRAALLAAALAVAGGAVVVLEERAHAQLSAHMLQHVLLGDLAPALALLGMRGRLRAPRWRLLRFLLRPVPSFAFWIGSLALWHVPAAYGAALETPPLHAAQHACFLAGGLLAWNQLLNRLPLWRSLAFALAMMASSQLLVMTLVLSAEPLYAAYAAHDHALHGLDPLADQQRAGLVMMFEQLLTLGTLTAFRLRAYVRRPLVLQEGRHPLGI